MSFIIHQSITYSFLLAPTASDFSHCFTFKFSLLIYRADNFPMVLKTGSILKTFMTLDSLFRDRVQRFRDF